MCTNDGRGVFSFSPRGLELIEDLHSSKQHIQLFKHACYGKMLVINGELQHAEACADLYHEPLVHLPASYLRKVRSCLIVGGGSLFAAREALRYRSLQRLLLVDHDPEVMNLMIRHYLHAGDVAGDQRFEYRPADGIDFLEGAVETFDLVINDCFDLRSGSLNSGRDLYQLLSRRMSIGGVCSDTSYRSIFEEHIVSIFHHIKQCSENIVAGLIVIPEYPGALHVHTVWGDAIDSRRHGKNRELLQEGGWASDLKYYNPHRREHFLYLPPRLRELIPVSICNCA